MASSYNDEQTPSTEIDLLTTDADGSECDCENSRKHD
jgi:hypothetical protein